MLQKKRVIYHLVVSVIFSLCTAFLMLFVFKLDAQFSTSANHFNRNRIADLTTGWQYHWGDSPLDRNGNFTWLDKSSSTEGWIDFSFPGRPKNENNYHDIWIRISLPESILHDASLRFRAPQQTVEVYLEDKLIFSYGSLDYTDKVRTPGSTWHFAELPEDFSGKTIYFRMHSPFPNYTGYLIEAAVGMKSDHYLDIYSQNIPDIVFGCFFIMVGIAVFLIGLTGSHKWRNIAYLGISSIFIGGWYLSESRIPQLFISMPVIATYAANFFIFLMPVWLLIYIEQAFTKKPTILQRILRLQWILHSLLTITAFTCDMAGILSSLYFTKILHVMLPISMVIIAYTIIRAEKDNLWSALLFISGVLALGLTGLADTFMMFYDTSPLLRTNRISYIGMMYFLATLLFNVGRELKRVYDQLENSSKENETNYKSLFTNMTEGFTYNKVDVDANGKINSCIILEFNDVFLEKTGLSRETVTGADICTLFPEIKALKIDPGDAYDEASATSDLCEANDPVRLGGKWYKLSTFCPKKNHLCIIFYDISEIKNAEETIRRQAYTDALTGFFNRTYFEDVMLRMYGMMQEIKPLSIIAIDIDGLKITNDTFGHNAGDMLLKDAARIISSVCKSSAITSRVGGDEFCIILPNTSYSAAQEKAEHIVKMAESVNSQNPVVPISMSIGLATSNVDDDEDIYSVYRRADDNMYRYKISQANSEKSKVIDMLLTALSERDYVSQGHVARLSELCRQMGDALNIHDIQKRNLILLSKVHDLGKIGIPDIILNKANTLTPGEYEKMKQHVKIGYNIASRSKELVVIAPLILHHHEHWDGGGYPDSLKGQEIPLECRILSIIDAFDAMTNDRPYHKGIPAREALKEIDKCAGKQFDPDLAKKFIELVSALHIA